MGGDVELHSADHIRIPLEKDTRATRQAYRSEWDKATLSPDRTLSLRRVRRVGHRRFQMGEVSKI